MKKSVALFVRTGKLNGDKLMGIAMITNLKKWKEPHSPDLFLITKGPGKTFEGVGTQERRDTGGRSEWESQSEHPELRD